jgi:FdhD protein
LNNPIYSGGEKRMERKISNKNNIFKFENGLFREQLDEIVTEFPFTIILNGEEFATMVCTPTYLDELVIGFLASEGVIRSENEIVQLQIDESKGFAYVDLAVKATTSQQFYSKRFIGSCCGKSRQF